MAKLWVHFALYILMNAVPIPRRRETAVQTRKVGRVMPPVMMVSSMMKRLVSSDFRKDVPAVAGAEFGKGRGIDGKLRQRP